MFPPSKLHLGCVLVVGAEVFFVLSVSHRRHGLGVCFPGGGQVDIRNRRDFSSFALPPGEPPALAALPRRRSHDLFAERPVAALFSSFGPAAGARTFLRRPAGHPL